MLVIARTDQESLFDLLDRANAEAVVGPTAPTGWTAAWTDDAAAAAETVSSWLIVFTDDHGGLCVRAAHDGVVAEADLVRGDAPDELHRVASLVSAAWDVDAADVAQLLAVERRPDGLIDALAEVLPLPEIDEPDELDAAVVVFNGKREDARTVGEMTGPLHVKDLPDGWLVLTGSVETMMRAAAGVSAIARRGTSVLRLWRLGAESGYEQWRRGKPEGGWSWNQVWRRTGAERLSASAEVSRLLEKRFGDRVADPVALRALLRRDAVSNDPLREFLDLIGVPTGAVAILDQVRNGEVGQAEFVDRAPWYTRILTTKTPEDVAKARSRPVWVTNGIIVLGALATAGLIGIALFSGARADWVHAIWSGALAVYFARDTSWHWRYVGLRRHRDARAPEEADRA